MKKDNCRSFAGRGGDLIWTTAVMRVMGGVGAECPIAGDIDRLSNTSA